MELSLPADGASQLAGMGVRHFIVAGWKGIAFRQL